MPRPLRIEYEGARYHVMCRGNRGTVVFGSDDDVRLFLKTLGEMVKRSELRVHGYVLMSTHYHLLLETPSGNLVEGMKWFQGAFTQRMNAMHQTWGHLFQGRYKAKIIDSSDPEYFKRVSEYIHLNPAAAGLLGRREPRTLSSYPWSSYAHYLAPRRNRPEWLTVSSILGEYNLQDTSSGRRRYGQLMEDRSLWAAGKQTEYQNEYRGMERGWIHGAQTFRDQMSDWVENKLNSLDTIYDASQKRDLTERAVEQVVKNGCEFLKIERMELASLKKGDPRKVLLASYIKEHYSLSNSTITQMLHMGHPTYISKCRPKIDSDRSLSRQYEKFKRGMKGE